MTTDGRSKRFDGHERARVVTRSLGEQLKRLRLERELTQRDLAYHAGLDSKHISRIELGRVDPGTITLIRLARALNITVGELFETVTPSGLSRFSPADLRRLTTATDDIEAVVKRLILGEPSQLPARAGRKAKRRNIDDG
jgi:transcriptional regulator with XRE-family HTH domain